VAQRNDRTARAHAPQSEQSVEFAEGPHGGADREDNHGGSSPTGGEHREPGAIEQFVQWQPLSSVMTGFGLGLGFGLMVTLLLTRREPSWYERHMPSTFQDLPERLRRVPESLGSYVPSSWKHS
jgi:hypothetical protein